MKLKIVPMGAVTTGTSTPKGRISQSFPCVKAPKTATDGPQFVDSGPGNGLWFSLKCFNKGSLTVDAKCKSNPLNCGHPHVKIDQEQIGKFVTINWSTVHTSAYPRKVDAFVAQFFFSLSTSAPSKPKRQRIEDRTAYTEGNFDPALASSVGRRIVREWSSTFVARDARASGIGKYQGKQLNNTKVWSKDIIENELEARCMLYENVS
jgi:hypothetical protein